MRRDILIGLACIGLLAALPSVVSSKYWLGQMVLMFIWVGVVTQWNLVLGYAGIFSLAQMLVFAAGGYGSAMMSAHLGASAWQGLLTGGLAALMAGAVVGAATLRLNGAYVALLTLGMASVVQSLITVDTACISFEGDVCHTISGGASGLSRLPGFGFTELLGYKGAILGSYYLGLSLMVLGSLFVLVTINSPLGHAFRALKDSPAAAAARGINQTKYKVLVFSVSAFFTGVFGAFYAGQFRAFGPSSLDMSTLLFLISALIVGGLGRFWGPLLGVALLMGFDEFVKDAAEFRMIGVGLFTVVCVIAFPSGLAGLLARMLRRAPA